MSLSKKIICSALIFLFANNAFSGEFFYKFNNGATIANSGGSGSGSNSGGSGSPVFTTPNGSLTNANLASNILSNLSEVGLEKTNNDEACPNINVKLITQSLGIGFVIAEKNTGSSKEIKVAAIESGYSGYKMPFDTYIQKTTLKNPTYENLSRSNINLRGLYYNHSMYLPDLNRDAVLADELGYEIYGQDHASYTFTKHGIYGWTGFTGYSKIWPSLGSASGIVKYSRFLSRPDNTVEGYVLKSTGEANYIIVRASDGFEDTANGSGLPVVDSFGNIVKLIDMQGDMVIREDGVIGKLRDKNIFYPQDTGNGRFKRVIPNISTSNSIVDFVQDAAGTVYTANNDYYDVQVGSAIKNPPSGKILYNMPGFGLLASDGKKFYGMRMADVDILWETDTVSGEWSDVTHIFCKNLE